MRAGGWRGSSSKIWWCGSPRPSIATTWTASCRSWPRTRSTTSSTEGGVSGKQAIREAFAPQFRGDFGRIRFLTEDLFVDPESGKALIRWLCTLESDGRSSGWRGLDILRFEEGLLAEKHTYAKAKVPLMVEKK